MFKRCNGKSMHFSFEILEEMNVLEYSLSIPKFTYYLLIIIFKIFCVLRFVNFKNFTKKFFFILLFFEILNFVKFARFSENRDLKGKTDIKNTQTMLFWSISFIFTRNNEFNYNC